MQSQVEQESADVVISGGGYVGLALALALVREVGSDLDIVVVDRALVSRTAGRDDPRASAISASSRNLLAQLGIWQRVADEAVPVAGIELTDSSLQSGVRRSLLSYENTAEGGEPASFILPNVLLGEALEWATAACPSIRRRHGVGVSGLEMSTAAATVTLDDGGRIACQLAVAADGRRSALREAAGIKTVGWNYDQAGIVTTISHEFDHHNRATQHFLPAGPFAMLPLKGGLRSCITWSETAAEARRIMALDDAAFLDEIDLRAAGRLGAVKVEGPRMSWPLEAHLARAYAAPRVALVGDAAHGVHPIGGQGLNLGYRDVAALAECVAEGARLGMGLADPAALTRYERWRRFDSAMSTAAYTGLNTLFSNDWSLLRSAREVGLGVLDKLPAVKRMLVQEAAGLSGDVPKLLRAP